MATRRRYLSRYKSSDIRTEAPPIVLLWLLRLLVPLGAQREFIRSREFRDDSLAELLGLGHWIDPTEKEFRPSAIRAELRELHRTAEQKLGRVTMPAVLGRNVDRLAGLVGLSDTDCRILEFATLVHNEPLLADVAEWLGEMSLAKICSSLSVLLGLSESDIRSSLNNQGALARSGLVALGKRGPAYLGTKIELLSDNFAEHIATSDADPIHLLRDTVSLAEPPQLQLSDYRHIEPVLAVLRPYLEHAVDSGRKGVNVFIHGVPGTGKSQLVRALAKEYASELFEVASEDENGDPVGADRRLRALRAALSVFSRRRALVVFDEAEDVFNDGDGRFGHKSTAQIRKAWINRTLEENTIPTFWLSNSITGVDPAFARRFDMVFELPVPPKRQREYLVREACHDLLDVAGIARLSGAEHLAPAVVTRAASVVRSIRDRLNDADKARSMELLINNTLLAQGHPPIRRNDPNQLPELYDPAIVNTDCDLARIASGLAQSRGGRICLFGASGTGKTAFGRWLAESLDLPLVVKRASDLLSKWVGESEKLIARAFRQAEQEGALLLIDEVDSFLQDRRTAQRSWEVTLVNEMLTQIESFAGIVVASTNLMEGLDPAALRRFDLKIKFDYLRPEQAMELFQRYCAALGIPTTAGRIPGLARISNLTPGDFAAVARQHNFSPIASAAALAAALEAECAAKEHGKTAIGFI